ncbi:transcriptional regulator [Clostridia bacterium]|nr:transcriptional regulator [Clostridia bacterium]
MTRGIREHISESILYNRKKLGLTQKQLAEAVGGIQHSAVSAWERGDNAPDIDIIVKLANIFEVSLSSLFGRDTDETEGTRNAAIIHFPQADVTPAEKIHLNKYRRLGGDDRRYIDGVMDTLVAKQTREYVAT